MTEEKKQITTSGSKLASFMVENYARPVSMDLGEWLGLNPPPVLCERKVDGFRIFLYKSGKKILLATRHGRIYSESSHPLLFRKLQPLLLDPSMPNRLILDGEYVSPDKLYLFDVLRVEEEETTMLPLRERKEILSSLLRKVPEGHEYEVDSVYARSYSEVIDFMNDLLAKAEEGIVVKNPSSKYGERNSWLKLKRFDTFDCVVINYERTKEMDQTGIPHSWFIGLYKGSGEIVEMGKVGTYLREVDPTKIKIGSVVEVWCQEVTEELKFRHPHIVRIREDKNPKDCTVDQLRRNGPYHATTSG